MEIVVIRVGLEGTILEVIFLIVRVSVRVSVSVRVKVVLRDG